MDNVLAAALFLVFVLAVGYGLRRSRRSRAKPAPGGTRPGGSPPTSEQ